MNEEERKSKEERRYASGRKIGKLHSIPFGFYSFVPLCKEKNILTNSRFYLQRIT
jgi:hypothetical protein